MVKRIVKKAAKRAAKPAGDQPKYRVNLLGIEKLEAAVEALSEIVALAPAGASGEGVSDSLRTQRRAAVAALRQVGAAVRQKVKELRALRPASFGATITIKGKAAR